jgi:hypothetical protein
MGKEFFLLNTAKATATNQALYQMRATYRPLLVRAAVA